MADWPKVGSTVVLGEVYDDLAAECAALKARLLEAENMNAKAEKIALRLAETERALRDACIGHPDNCGCNGCRIAFRATDSADGRGTDDVH